MSRTGTSAIPRRERMENPRARIHAVAVRLFARYGFEGVSMQRIADEVGLHKSSLFHHYRGKIELAAEVFESAVVPVIEIIKPLADDDPPTIEGFLLVVEDLVDHFSDQPDAARLIVSTMSAPQESDLRSPYPETEQTYVTLFTIVWSWLERARNRGVIRQLNIRQAILNTIGLVLFYPAVAPEEEYIAGPDPFSPKARAKRKEELRYMLRGMLEPIE